jgi:hypothetical protein
MEERRLEFVNGGFVQHDEALTDLDSLILSLEAGHEFFLEHKLPRPTVAWQIGSYGHSNITPSVYRQFGYDYLVINHVPSEEKEHLSMNQDLEFIWVGADLG